MKPRAKKLIGTILTLVWIPVYAFFVVGVAAHLLPHASWYATLIFYALAGTLWALPVAMMFPWMYREPKS